MSSQTKHVKYMDLVKAFGIIAVVLGHAGGPLGKYVYLYHMALFFFVSGYFYRDYLSEQPWTMIKKRITGLYLPFVLYEMVFVLLHNTLYRMNIYNDRFGFGEGPHSHLYSFSELVHKFNSTLFFGEEEQLLGAFWFIMVLFFSSVIFGLVSWFTHNFVHKDSEYIRALIIIAISGYGFYCITIDKHFPKLLELSYILVGLYYLGYLFKKFEHKIVFNVYYVIAAVALLYLNGQYGDISVRGFKFQSPAFFLACSVLGIYINIYAAKVVAERYNPRVLYYIGANTMVIMALHFLAFKVVNLAQVIIYDNPLARVATFPVLESQNGWWIVFTVVGVVLPAAAKYGWQRLVAAVKFEPRLMFQKLVKRSV